MNDIILIKIWANTKSIEKLNPLYKNILSNILIRNRFICFPKIIYPIYIEIVNKTPIDIFLYSAENGHLAIVKLLSTFPGVADDNYALRMAALGGHFNTVKFLVTLPG